MSGGDGDEHKDGGASYYPASIHFLKLALVLILRSTSEAAVTLSESIIYHNISQS